jgi:hypothetical protein
MGGFPVPSSAADVFWGEKNGSLFHTRECDKPALVCYTKNIYTTN